MLELRIETVQDAEARENFKRILEFSSSNPLFASNFKVFSVQFLKAESNLKFPHGLSFQPQDIIITNVVPAGSLSFDYSSTDRTNLVLSTTGACTARFLVGTLGGT